MSDSLGSGYRPLRVAIVGSGPSGFYAAEALLKSETNTKVDMFDRLPVPFGLVRYGVAPDHPKIKSVTRVYDKVAENEAFSFFGNVKIGEALSVDELKTYYDAIIFTCGAETDKKLGIPGEDLSGSHTATEFVAWYNGHPDHRDKTFDLSGKVAVVIGQGNVAMDVSRILSKTVDELKTTDIAQHALDALADSNIKEVHLIGRRGPAQTAFTSPEIREFGELVTSEPIVKAEDMELSSADKKELEMPENKLKNKNVEILQGYADQGSTGKEKKFVIHFFESPHEIQGDGKVEKIILGKNELTGEPGKQKASDTGERFELECDLVFRSVGYRGIPIEGVPFRDDWGTFPNEKGRITHEPDGDVVPGLYTAGWIKRGPSGVIGTNKPDSVETVNALLEDASSLEPCPNPSTDEVVGLLESKSINYVTYDAWKQIDAAETAAGEANGKPREKFVTIDEMLGAMKA